MFMEMTLHLGACCPSALPPGLPESSRAAVSDDQRSCRAARQGFVCPWKEQPALPMDRAWGGQRQQILPWLGRDGLKNSFLVSAGPEKCKGTYLCTQQTLLKDFFCTKKEHFSLIYQARG